MPYECHVSDASFTAPPPYAQKPCLTPFVCAGVNIALYTAVPVLDAMLDCV